MFRIFSKAPGLKSIAVATVYSAGSVLVNNKDKEIKEDFLAALASNEIYEGVLVDGERCFGECI